MKVIKTINLTPLLEALASLAIALITCYAIPWLKQKIGKDKLEQTRAWAEIAVRATEQIYSGPGRGEAKKEYVLDFLNARGFHVDFSQLEALLESAVNDLKNQQNFRDGGEVVTYD